MNDSNALNIIYFDAFFQTKDERCSMHSKGSGLNERNVIGYVRDTVLRCAIVIAILTVIVLT